MWSLKKLTSACLFQIVREKSCENYNYLNQSELGNFSMHIIIGEMYSEMKMVDENHRAIGFQSRRTQMSGSPNNDALTENYNYKAGQK